MSVRVTRFDPLGDSWRKHPRVPPGIQQRWTFLLQRYLVHVQREDEPLADRWGEALVGLDELVRVPPDVPDVEHVVQAAVAVGDEVAHQVASVLVRVDVVKDDQSVTIETGGDGLSCRPVDDVKDGLEQEGLGLSQRFLRLS